MLWLVWALGCGDDAPAEEPTAAPSHAATATGTTERGTPDRHAAQDPEAPNPEQHGEVTADEVTAASAAHHGPPDDFLETGEPRQNGEPPSADEAGVGALVVAHRERMRRERRAAVHVIRTRDA